MGVTFTEHINLAHEIADRVNRHHLRIAQDDSAAT
jgi:hypothetical protein